MLAGLFLLFFISARADEGMWIPSLLNSKNIAQMNALGLKLSPQQIYDVNQSSLKDAVVQFGNGCTGELISASGLLLTNHHCGLGQIQEHSSVENDILQSGFWARNHNEELVNPGLSVKFLIRIDDVSDAFRKVLDDNMNEKDREKVIREKSQELQKSATEGTYYDARVFPFYEGNEFYLFVYETYKDVRLVGTPPWGIGKFGADTDNWMWPRQKGDFCLFRVYSGPDGKPAEYAAENIPLKSKHFLPISLKGIQENDYAMILGYPGRTDRYLSSWGVNMLMHQTAPSVIDVRTKKLEIYRGEMDASKEVFIQYASKQARVSNYWKYSIGQLKQLKNNRVMEKKQIQEAEFEHWLSKSPDRNAKYSEALTLLREGYQEMMYYKMADQYFTEAIYGGSEILPFAWKYASISQNPKAEKADFLKDIDSHFKDYYEPLDRKILAAMLLKFEQEVNPEFYPAGFVKIKKKARGDYSGYVDQLFKKSSFGSKEKMLQLLESGNSFQKDPAFKLISEFMGSYRSRSEDVKLIQEKINRGERIFLAGLREMQTNRNFYPDANFTMRLTYGKIAGYQPADAVKYSYYSTLDGVMEKEIPGNWEFDVPSKLKELHQSGDYGRYANEKGELVVNFITNNDITGGNSGSPVLDANGALIGCAFDGNWEAMSGDISFEPELQRTIVVDARYILFVIDKMANARNLMNELQILQ